jgi:hypothetical protein
MDYETISPADFGAHLRGLGLNLLVRDLRAEAGFLSAVFGLGVHRLSDDFAILTYGEQVMQLHADATYASHPLHALLPETPPRGAGAALHLFDTDPDEAAARAGSPRAPSPMMKGQRHERDRPAPQHGSLAGAG